MSAELRHATPTLVERYALAPEEIERQSLARVRDALTAQARLSGAEAEVVGRVVYAAGDLSLIDLARIHPRLIEASVQAIRRKAPIVTDVRMVEAGLDRRRLALFGNEILCAIDDPDVAIRARETGLPRAVLAMRSLADRLDGAIVAIGNAPTALLALLDLVDAGQVAPAAIVGTPVGFVAATEAKDELTRRAIPYLTIEGSRGGSPFAASAVNALLRLAEAAENPSGVK